MTQTIKHHGKVVRQPVPIKVIYNTSADNVTLTLAGKVTFANGGQIVVNAQTPSGINDTVGEYLNGNGQGVPGVNAIFNISPKGLGITRS